MELQMKSQSATVHVGRPLRRKRPVRNLPERMPEFDERKIIYHNLTEKILVGCGSPEEQFRTILLARGFLLEVKDGRLFLSSNSDYADFGYLDKLLSSKELGYFSRNGQNISRDPCRLDYDWGGYSKAGWGDEIVLTKELTIDDLLTLLTWCEGFDGSSLCNQGWGKQFSDEEFVYHREHGLKVPLKVIEPGIARFIKSLSACGVSTSMSCDGHCRPHGRGWIEFHSYLDHLWFRLIIEGVVVPLFSPHLRFRYQKMRNDWNYDVKILLGNDPAETYLELQRVATFLYEHRMTFRELKNKSCLEYQNPNVVFQRNIKDFDPMHSADWVGQNELCLSWMKGCLCVDRPLPMTEAVRIMMLEHFGAEGRGAIEWIESDYRIPRGQQGIDRRGVTRQISLDSIPWQQVPATNKDEQKDDIWR